MLNYLLLSGSVLEGHIVELWDFFSLNSLLQITIKKYEKKMKTHDGERTGKISIIFLVGTVGRRGFCISEALLTTSWPS